MQLDTNIINNGGKLKRLWPLEFTGVTRTALRLESLETPALGYHPPYTVEFAYNDQPLIAT